MKRGWLATFFLTAALAAWLNISEGRAASENMAITLCYGDVDARPWHYRRGGGLDIQLLERSGKRAGVTFKYEAMPWQACLAALQTGIIDGALGEDFGTRPGAVTAADGSIRLHTHGGAGSQLVWAPGFVSKYPGLAMHIRNSVEATHASAGYLILERQTLSALAER